MLRAKMPSDPQPWPLARPDLDGFEIAGTRDTPCLLLHGFTAAPTEVRPLAMALSAAGFPVRALRLPGHGTDVEELARTGRGRWIDAIGSALEALPPGIGAYLVGQSMGGLLALAAAARWPDRVGAVVTLAAPLRFADPRARAILPILRHTPLGRLVRFLPKAPSAIPEERRPLHFTYTRFPVAGLLELQDLMRDVERLLPRVRAPLLVVHGRLDRTAPFASAPRILALAGSARKEMAEFARSRHVLTMDVESEAVCERIGSFLSGLAAGRAPGDAFPGATAEGA